MTPPLLPTPIIKRRRARSNPFASTRAFSPLQPQGVIAIASIFARSLSSHAASAVASPPIRIICVTCNRVRSAASRAMNLPCRSAGSTIGRCIAPGMSEPGGRQPASIQSKSPISCGKTPASMRGGSSPRARHKLPPQIEGHNRAVTFWSLRRRPDESDMLTQIGACTDLYHTATGTAFADIIVGHRETWPIRSQRFRAWLRRRYYEATGEAASTAEIRSALGLLEARAQFDGPERAVHIRIAEHAGNTYLDLADDHWRAVEVGPDGWRVIGCPPVRFRRPAGMLPLPVPQQGGSIEALNP